MNIAEDMKRIRAALLGRARFVSSLLGRARIISVDCGEIPTAGVDVKTRVYINKNFWETLDFTSKVYLIAHEVAGHAAFLHPLRERGRVGTPERMLVEHHAWNIAADAKTYQVLEELVRAPDMECFAVSPRTISEMTGENEENIRKMSVEEVYDLLAREIAKSEIASIVCEVDILSVGAPGGEVVQEGDPSLRDGSPSELKEAWKALVARAYMSHKSAGTIPAGLERVVNELIRPKLNPRALLRSGIRAGLGKLMVSDWKRTSRRYSDLPGVKRFTVPTIWALVDASGSITEDEIKLSLGTIYEFSRHARINVISFDTDSYELVAARRPADVITKVAKGIRGGGGTMVESAIRTTIERMKLRDIIVVTTDGHIFDIEKPEVQTLLTVAAGRASVCFFCTTDKEVFAERWRTIRLERRAS